MPTTERKSIPEELASCLLFRGLSFDERAIIASRGTPKPLVAGTVLSFKTDPLTFLAVVLAGKVKVKYDESKIFTEGEITHGPGRFFGRMDQAILLGKLVRVEALETTILLEFDKEATLQILGQFTSVKEQLSRVKLAIEARIQQKELDQQGLRDERIPAGQTSTEVAPRYDILAKGLLLRFPDGNSAQVRDASSSGLFVMATFSVIEGEEVKVLLDCPSLNIGGMQLILKPKRIVKEGVGCSIVFANESEKSQWEDTLLQLKTQQIETSFEKYLTPLSLPIDATISKDDSSMRCLIVKLGLEGALLQCKKRPPEGISFFSFSFIGPLGGKQAFSNDIEYVKTIDGQELIRFVELSFDNQKNIQEILAHHQVSEVVSASIKDNEDLMVESSDIGGKSYEYVDVLDQKQLNNLYVRELSYNMLILYACTKFKVGDVVDVMLRIQFTPKKRGLKNPNFPLKGRVARIVNANAVVELINPPSDILSTLSDIVNAHQSMSMAASAAIIEEGPFSGTQRKLMQLVLLLILLALFVLWNFSQSEV